MRTALTLALGFWMAAGLAAQDRALGQRVFDVTGLTGFRHADRPASIALPLREAYERLRSERESTPTVERSALGIDRVVDVLSEVAGGQELAEEGVFVIRSGGRIIANGPPPMLERMQATVDYLEKALAASGVVRVHLVPAVRLGRSGPGVLGPEEVAAILQDLAGVEPIIVPLDPRGRGRIRSGDTLTFVGDYDVEVAQKAQIADPLIVALDDGIDLSFEVLAGADGAAFLRVSGRVAEVDSVSERAVRSTWIGRIQTPVVDSLVVAGSGLVPAGGGLVLGASEGDEDKLVLVTLEMPKAPAPLPGFAVFPTAVAASNRTLDPMRIASPPGSGSFSSGEESFDAEPFLEIDRVVDILRNRVEPSGWESDPLRTLVADAPYVVAKAPEPVLAAIGRTLADLQGTFLRNVAIEVRLGWLDAAAARAVAEGKADLASVAGLLRSKAQVGAVVGDGFRILLGREVAYIRDHDVEIAEDATIADPIVDTLFTGVGLQGAFRCTGSATVLEAEFVIQDLVGEIVPFAGNTDDIGEIDLPRTAAARARVSVGLEPGRWTAVGLVPSAGHDRSLAILVRIRG